MHYILDTNIFIDSKNRYYSFEICPGFWDAIEVNKKITTIEMVVDEIKRYEDNLARWFQDSSFKNKIIKIDEEIQRNFSEIAEYVNNLDKKDSEKNKFLSGADPWLIATCKTYGYFLVTSEVAVGIDSKKIKIPNICEVFEVKYISLFEMLKREKIKFYFKN